MMRTLCPACRTAFRVTPEQLKARQGRVRCGQCMTQFNALDALAEDIVADVPASQIQAGNPVSASVDDFAAGHMPPQVADDIPYGPIAPETHIELLQEPAQSSQEPVFAEPAEEVSVPALNTPEPLPEQPAKPVPAESSTEITGTSPVMAEAVAIKRVRSGILGERYDTSFPTLPWEEPVKLPRRWPWVIGSVLTLFALILQAAIHFRVELAVLQPQLKPLLRTACKYAKCEISLPRHAEYLGIESSDLHPDTALKGQLLLATTLKNRAPFAQEFPYMELTLNDVSDHPLITKSLAPRDYLPKGTDAAKGFAVNSDLAVNLTLDVGDVPAAGYRIYLFYP